MSKFNIGDRVDDGWGNEGTITEDLGDGNWAVLLDGELTEEMEGDLKLLKPGPVGLLDEVQVLINILVSTGHDQPRVLSRKVAQLMTNTRGALSRSDKLQCAAMLLVSAGLRELADPERDDG